MNVINREVLSGPRKQLIFFIVVLLFIFVTLELWFSRFHFLDDSFIHLRIAHNLLIYGQFTYNGSVSAFATSSPLYTTVLSIFSIISDSSYIPKIANLIIYLIILFFIVRFILSNKNPVKAVFLFASLLLIISPLSIRWLTDGMETGLVALSAIILANISHKAIEGKSNSLLSKMLTIILSVLAVLLRVEFGYILASVVISISISCIICHRTNLALRIKYAFSKSLPFIIGGLLGACIIVLIFGNFLPDSAIAKQSQSGTLYVLKTLETIFTAHFAASFFGIGLLILWVTSLVFAYRTGQNNVRVFILVTNTGILLFILLLLITQQQIQGIRYFIFIEVFLIALNILCLPNVGQIFKPRKSAYIVFIITLIWIAFDSVIFYRLQSGRSESYKHFVETDYNYLENMKGIAWDIGMVGYFTRADILDVSGIVNGRKKASLTNEQRLESFSKEKIYFVFVNDSQLKAIKKFIDVSNWRIVGEFDFPNVSGKPDSHYLIVNPYVLPSSYRSMNY